MLNGTLFYGMDDLACVVDPEKDKKAQQAVRDLLAGEEGVHFGEIVAPGAIQIQFDSEDTLQKARKILGSKATVATPRVNPFRGAARPQ